MKSLIIVPAYNEGENIERVITTIKDKCSQCDYIIVNDGSTDNTEEICKAKGYHFVSHPVNLGLAAAVQTGMIMTPPYSLTATGNTTLTTCKKWLPK